MSADQKNPQSQLTMYSNVFKASMKSAADDGAKKKAVTDYIHSLCEEGLIFKKAGQHLKALERLRLAVKELNKHLKKEYMSDAFTIINNTELWKNALAEKGKRDAENKAEYSSFAGYPGEGRHERRGSFSSESSGESEKLTPTKIEYTKAQLFEVSGYKSKLPISVLNAYFAVKEFFRSMVDILSREDLTKPTVLDAPNPVTFKKV